MRLNRRLFDTAADGDAGGGGGDQSTGMPASTGEAPAGGSTDFAWNDGWRERMAQAIGSTDPDKELKQLSRYESPEQIWKKARELERRQSSGEFLPRKPETEDQNELGKWREQHGIPTQADEYKINMPEGKEKPAEDDPFLQAFKKAAHEADYSQSQFDRAVASFYDEVDRQIAENSEKDAELREKTEDILRQDWGQDYRVNKNLAEQLLARAPEAFRDKFWNGYLADHTPISASPEAWKWLVQMEREINPAATLVPNTGGSPGKGIQERLEELGKMRDSAKGSKEWKHYWEGPGEKEYRDLLTAREKIKEKEGA